jgi:hypothetical protein
MKLWNFNLKQSNLSKRGLRIEVARSAPALIQCCLGHPLKIIFQQYRRKPNLPIPAKSVLVGLKAGFARARLSAANQGLICFAACNPSRTVRVPICPAYRATSLPGATEFTLSLNLTLAPP